MVRIKILIILLCFQAILIYTDATYDSEHFDCLLRPSKKWGTQSMETNWECNETSIR